ncbi:MAG TPA: mandelate racemase/muconate lactonizing enzyme family protein [Chloroflexota bacterium]|nr:mandelate racemase/muconate lactonizing enzyme family protein [Chloroflexota bacterium]
MMRIRNVTPVSVSYPEPNDNNNIRYLTLCRVEADDGTVGWGESITQFPESSRATEQLIEGWSALLVGQDPLDNQELWRRLKRHSWWYGYQGGIAAFALSAIDIALWDLKGKILGQPLVKLLGGAHRERLPVIASTHAFLPSIEQEAERHGAYVQEEGYQGVKIGFGKRGQARLGYEAERDITFVRLLREAVGPRADIMIDRGQSLQWDLRHAILLTNAFEEQGLRWIEEPLEPQDIEGFRKLRQHVKTLIATGEREWHTDAYQRLIATGIVDVVGCDPGRAEGITGFQKLIQLVENASVWFNAHAWSSAIITAASLALSASSDRCLVFEMKPIPNPMQDELVTTPFKQKDGWIDVPMAPGLGVEVREETIAKYRF